MCNVYDHRRRNTDYERSSIIDNFEIFTDFLVLGGQQRESCDGLEESAFSQYYVRYRIPTQ